MTINIDKNELIEYVTNACIEHTGMMPDDPEDFDEAIHYKYNLPWANADVYG